MNKPLLIVTGAVLLAQIAVTAPLIDGAVDARVYHDTAQRLVHHQPLYVESPRRNPYDVTNTFLYPPPFAALLRPFAYLSFGRFLGYWYALLGAALGGLWAALALLFFGEEKIVRSPLKTMGLALLALVLTPGVEASIAIGNADLIIWALAAWALVWPTPTPLLAATILKVYPGPAWLLLSLRTKYRVSWRAGVVLLAVAALTAYTVDIGEWRRNGIPATLSGNFTFYNWSLSTLPLRWIAPWDRLLSPGFRAYLSATSIAGPLVVAWFARRLPIRTHTATVLLASTAFAPLCWWYRLPIGLLLVGAAATADRRGGCVRGVVAVSSLPS